MRYARWARVAVALATVAMLGSRDAFAQAAYDSPQGRVEVLGLSRWTLAMLRDSIRRYVPGQELHDAACMVTLRDSLHFAEASVEFFESAPPGRPVQRFLAIKVLEPEHAARVQWDARPRNEFTSLRADYAPTVLAFTDTNGALRRGRVIYWLQFADDERAAALARAPEAARADGERMAAFLTTHASEADRVRAMRTFRSDGFWVNRVMAAAVLSHFSANDSTWYALARALRDPHEGVRETAALVLGALPPRPVDWRPVATDLRLLLGGTNLPAIVGVMRVLARTSVDPALAPALLHDNADWVLAHFASEAPMASDVAHALLLRLNAGRDLGPARGAWIAWARTL